MEKAEQASGLCKPQVSIQFETSYVAELIILSMFRSGADDGALCGILLTPLVASSKLVSTASNHTDDKNVQTDCM